MTASTRRSDGPTELPARERDALARFAARLHQRLDTDQVVVFEPLDVELSMAVCRAVDVVGDGPHRRCAPAA